MAYGPKKEKMKGEVDISKPLTKYKDKRKGKSESVKVSKVGKSDRMGSESEGAGVGVKYKKKFAKGGMVKKKKGKC